MIFNKPLPFVQEFLDQISEQLKALNKNYELSRLQKAWITFCIMGVIVTGTLCWSHFERFGLGRRTVAALSWMLRKSVIAWEFLLVCAVRVILAKYSITDGHLIIDDTDRQRSKSTKKIDRVHKIHDKKTGGYFMGQNIVLLLLVTDKITIPVGFKFYLPDPEKTAWVKKDKELRRQNVSKSQRPLPPKRNFSFPTKIDLALQLLAEFKKYFSNISVKSISADALYGSKKFFKKANLLFPTSQIISQLKSNQKVWYKNKLLTLSEVFSSLTQNKMTLSIRGGDSESVIIAAAKIRVDSHKKSRFIIALKYEGENDFRYIVASNLTWRAMDIAKAYSLRWLIEVFFSDWKRYEGWGQLALQQGVDGSCRGVILSLLVDLCLLFHPEQVARIENKMPAFTVGSRKDQLGNEALLSCFQDVLESPSPFDAFVKMKDSLSNLFKLRESSKHLINRQLKDLRPELIIRRHREGLAVVA